MQNVVALATGKTYDLVLGTGVTAHPALAPYPRWYPDYLVPIKKGGAIEVIYSVSTIIECVPDKISEFKDKLTEGQYKQLVSYHERRLKTIGYKKTGEKYRFYILKQYAGIKQPFEQKNIQCSKKMSLEDIPMER